MKDQKQEIKMSMKVKILNTFLSPLTNRLTVKGETISVPKQRFWYRRINDKDVEIVENKKEVAAPKKVETPKKELTKNGSK